MFQALRVRLIPPVMGIVYPFGHGQAMASVEVNAATNTVAAAPGWLTCRHSPGRPPKGSAEGVLRTAGSTPKLRYASLGCGTFGGLVRATGRSPRNGSLRGVSPKGAPECSHG